MNGAAITRPCTGCKKHFIGVAPGLCPACEKDSAIYKASRKKGDPREFLPYPELLDQWRRLVQLAHPDKHGGSAAAVEATRWLLENRA